MFKEIKLMLVSLFVHLFCSKIHCMYLVASYVEQINHDELGRLLRFGTLLHDELSMINIMK